MQQHHDRHPSRRGLQATAAAIALAFAASGAAMAQTSSSGSTTSTVGTTQTTTTANTSRSSWLPYTHNGYIGFGTGRSSFQNSCGSAAFACDDDDTMGRIYMGGYFSPHFGAEIGYADMGDMQRAGGRTDARGLNLSLLGRAPVTQTLNLYGKLGLTYGRTRVSALPGSGITAGNESGWGPAYAVGVDWHFAPNWSAVLEWDRTRYDFAGNNRDWVRSINAGLRYNF